MESVMKKIRQAHKVENERQAVSNIAETIVNGCQVKLRFSTLGDNKIMSTVQSILISAHLDTVLTSLAGGDRA